MSDFHVPNRVTDVRHPRFGKAYDLHAPSPSMSPFLVGPKARETGAWSPLTRFHYPDPAAKLEDLAHGEALQDKLFLDAALIWLEWRQPSFRGATGPSYEQYIKALEKFLGAFTLRQITATHLRQYQSIRRVNAGGLWLRTAGASAINHELNTLQQILRHAQLWAPVANFYRPLPLPHWTPPRVMTAEQSDLLYGLAATRVEWDLAYIVATISVNTTASGCELRCLQRSHVHMDEEPCPLLFVPSEAVKNEYRARVVPLNNAAALQMERALERAASLGSEAPNHFIFPFRVKRGCYDPTRPASKSWIRNQFDKLRLAAGLPWLRPHDLRHQAITEMLEASVPEKLSCRWRGTSPRQCSTTMPTSACRQRSRRYAFLSSSELSLCDPGFRFRRWCAEDLS